MPTENEKPAVTMEVGEYKGNPMLTFKEGEKDRFPFSFGAGKARKLLGFIEANGAEAFVIALKAITTETDAE